MIMVVRLVMLVIMMTVILARVNGIHALRPDQLPNSDDAENEENAGCQPG